ncbi:MAG: putative Ig domain-containing protein [Prosthecobacter sp.]|nr:putative Ig domain-containing protein [Prosthecobacter sp.]
MKMFPSLQKLKRVFSKSSSFLLLFQRSPAAQILLPEINLLTTTAAFDTTKIVIATVVGLGAYDSVAGATTVSQVAPSAGSSTVPVTSGTNLAGVFQIVGGGGHTPQSWSVSSGTLPTGLTLKSTQGKTTTLTGVTTQSGNKTVTIRGWENSNFSGRSASATFTIAVSAPPGAAITSQPASTTINSGSTATLSVAATGGSPITYQWYEGASGTTTNPVGSNSSSFTTPILSATTSYWVNVSNSVTPSGVNSDAATVTVRQPAAIVTHPGSTTINSGESTTLSVLASGDAPLNYQWYQGTSGVTTTPVGTNAASFTTPTLVITTDYWVKVTNVANPTGANSTTATVTVNPAANPVIFTASSLPSGSPGTSYSVNLEAAGGTTPYTWTLSSGTLPSGLQLTEAGVLSGLPTDNGTSTFTVQVEDSNGFKDTAEFTVTMSDLSILTNILPTAVKGVAFDFSLQGTGGSSPYTWTVNTGTLPSGIQLSSNGVFSGTPTVAGNSTFTVRLSDDASFSVLKQLTLPVSATYSIPIIDPLGFTPTTIGADFTYQVTAQNYPQTFSIKGLPKGLKANAKTGLITGRPTVSGTFNVSVTAKNTGGTSATVTGQLFVNTLGDNLVGNFGGLIARDSVINRGLGGYLTVSTTSKGTYSLKVVSALSNSGSKGGSASYAAKGFLADSAPQISALVGGETLTLTVNADTGELTGTLGSAAVNGWRSAWNAKTNPADTFQGYYSLALNLSDVEDSGVVSIPQGTGFASFSASLAGTLSVVGKTADGESITGATFLGSQGEFWVYTPLYKKVGTIQGQLNLNLNQSGFEDNSISGPLTWFKPSTVSRAYADSFGPINLLSEGGYLGPLSKRKLVLGLPAVGSVLLSFTDGGLAASETNPDMSFTFTDKNKVTLPAPLDNPGKVVVAITPATGKVSGKFSLVETNPALKRSNVPFLGQVVRLSDGSVKAVGYFMLPQIPEPNQKPTATTLLSGGFSLEQLNP